MFVMTTDLWSVPLRFTVFKTELYMVFNWGQIDREPVIMAACLWVILPPLMMYLFTQ